MLRKQSVVPAVTSTMPCVIFFLHPQGNSPFRRAMIVTVVYIKNALRILETKPADLLMTIKCMAEIQSGWKHGKSPECLRYLSHPLTRMACIVSPTPTPFTHCNHTVSHHSLPLPRTGFKAANNNNNWRGWEVVGGWLRMNECCHPSSPLFPSCSLSTSPGPPSPPSTFSFIDDSLLSCMSSFAAHPCYDCGWCVLHT